MWFRSTFWLVILVILASSDSSLWARNFHIDIIDNFIADIDILLMGSKKPQERWCSAIIVPSGGYDLQNNKLECMKLMVMVICVLATTSIASGDNPHFFISKGMYLHLCECLKNKDIYKETHSAIKFSAEKWCGNAPLPTGWWLPATTLHSCPDLTIHDCTLIWTFEGLALAIHCSVQPCSLILQNWSD